MQTIITRLKNNIAKGFIVNSDLTLKKCYIVKQNNCFAHGETLKKAMKSLNEKLYEDMIEEERIEAFLSEFSTDEKHSAKKFFDWHGKLTGSCELGREQFVKDRGIDLENDYYTIEEFVDLCKNSYGGEILKMIRIEEE